MTSASPGTIAIDGLSVAYGSGAPVIERMSLAVAPGEFHAILGPSGCGKTTLLKALAGLVPSSGTVAGLERSNVAYVPQGNSCFPWLSAVDNVAYGLWTRGVSRSTRRDRARELLDRMDLAGHHNDYPATLSEGMRQRVAVARAFATDASILLMDEPFSALDYQTKLGLQGQLLDLWRERRASVLFVTHDIDEALVLADRVTVLTRRPARVRETIEVPFARPRNHAAIRLDERYGPLYARCNELLAAPADGALA